MLDKIAQINRWAVVGVFVLLLIGGTLAWDRLMYSPAKQQRSAAQQALEGAQGQLTTQQAKLKEVEDKALDRSPMGEILVAKRAIPGHDNRDEALVEIDRYAKKANVTIKEVNISDQDPNQQLTEATTNGMAPSRYIDFKIDAQSTYRAMILFIDEMQGAVDEHRGKVYVRGRLFNAVDLAIATTPQSQNGTTEKLPPGVLSYSLTVRVYADDSSAAAATDAAAPLGAAAPTGTPTTPAAGAPGATATTPGATTPGAATPGATSTTPGATPAAGSTTPSTQAVPPGAS